MKFYEEIKENTFPETTLTWKEIILILIQRKQLEFVGGGLVEHDEALVTYQSMIDQITGKFSIKFNQ